MILMIDNYDSFTYNLVQYFEEQGEALMVVKNDAMGLAEISSLNPEALVVSPGPSSPAEAGISVDAIRYFGSRIPVLGVCLGHQSIACAYGGRVIVHDRLMHGKISPIYHDGRTIYKNMGNPFQATRYHSLVVEESTFPACLEVSARSDQGEIMGIRHRHLPVEGVQFHPESIMTLEGKKMIANFIGLKDGWKADRQAVYAG